MEKKENLEIKMAPEELTAEDLKKVNGGMKVNGCTRLTLYEKEQNTCASN